MSSADPNYLLNEQYRDGSKLSARAQLHIRFSTSPLGWMRWLFERCELGPNARVLELGCGPAGFWWENRERIPPGWQITLSDFSPGMLEEARARLSGLEPALRFQCFDARAIPLPDASLDAVFAHHMLYHVPDRQRALAEIARVLAPAGVLYAATNGAENMLEIDELVAAVAPEIGWVFVEAREFTLENGAQQLFPHFADVSASWYDDALRVTEVEPLIAYIRSGPAGARLSEEPLARLRQNIAASIAAQGALRIRKSTGVFAARRPKR